MPQDRDKDYFEDLIYQIVKGNWEAIYEIDNWRQTYGQLNATERAILDWTVMGDSKEKIAKNLSKTPIAIREHLKRIKKKFLVRIM